MRLPEIRYPLFWIVGGAALALAVGVAWPRTRPLRLALAAAWQRAVAGPPVPASPEPQVVAGALTRRALLLHEATPVTDVPGGRVVQMIRRRNFADIYDIWPTDPGAAPSHYRIGNRRPFGWVAAGDVLPWDTRLVVRAPDRSIPLSDRPDGPSGPVEVAPGAILPILGWRDGSAEVAVWSPGAPWQTVARTGWLKLDGLPPGAPGILLSRDELLRLWRDASDADTDERREALRLDAILGRLAGTDPIPPETRAATWAALPTWAVRPDSPARSDASTTLARLYEDWQPDASWSGIAYRILPLDTLP